MESKNSKILKSISPSKVIIPVLVGFGAVLLIFLNNDEFSWELIAENISNAHLGWIFLAVLVLIARDAGYVYRIRNLTNKELSWVSSVFVIILWEFASAVTPSVVGGTAVVIFIINKEGIPLGRSLAFVMLTAVLDNFFFVFASIVVFLLLPFNDIFPVIGNGQGIAMEYPLSIAFLISVILIALYTLVMIYGLMIRPRAFKWIMIKLTGNRLLKRFRKNALQIGSDVIMASKILKGNRKRYWTKAILSTIFIWTARYFMLNCLIAAFTDISPWEHLIILGRHLIMWIVMLISPTPGSTGTAEYVFGPFFEEFFTVSAFTLAVALFWRLFTYYAYLGLGILVLPQWLKRVFGVKKIKQTDEEEVV